MLVYKEHTQRICNAAHCVLFKLGYQFTVLTLMCALSFILSTSIYASITKTKVGHGRAQLLHHLSHMQTLAADFNQQTSNSKGKVMNRLTGRLYVKRPNRFRLESSGHDGKELIIANGHRLWIYDVEMEQVIIKPISKLNQTNLAALLSGSANKVMEKFDLISYLSKPNRIEEFVLKPKQEGSEIQSLTLLFKHARLLKLMMIDKLDQRSQLNLSHQQINRPVSARIFQFIPPPGVDVIEE